MTFVFSTTINAFYFFCLDKVVYKKKTHGEVSLI